VTLASRASVPLKIEPVVMKNVLGLSVLLCAMGAPLHAQADQDWTQSAVLARVDEASRDVLAARRSVDAARADQASASVTPAAQFSLLSQAIDTQHLGHGSLWSRPVDTIARIDKPLERGGKQALRERQAQAALQAAQSDVADTLRSQRMAALQAYWDVKLAQEQLGISQRNQQLAQDSSRAARLRLAQGDLSRLESTRLAVEAERAANEVAQASLLLMQTRLALAQALALDGAAAQSLRAADPWPKAQPDAAGVPKPDSTDASWLDQRPDVRAAQQRLTQAQAALELAQAQRKADVTVSVQFEHNPVVANRLWGVGVAFPLGVDERQNGPVTRALVAQADAQALLDKVRSNALLERLQQSQALSTAQERLQRLESQLLPQAREALKAAEFAREQGALSLQDVLDARRSLHAAELDAAAAHADAAKAWAALSLSSDQTAVTP
jgi:cobalt-zinc-cadmium efflux system outer membrane protein